MKNLKNMLGLMVVSALAMVGMTNVHAEVATTCAKDKGASIGTACYDNFDAAVEDLADGDTIKLLANATPSSGVSIDEDNVTIDLNGFNITLAANSITVSADSALTITGSGEITGTRTLISVSAGSKVVVDGSTKLTQSVASNYATYAANPVIMVADNADAKKSTVVEVGSGVTVKSENGYGLVLNGTKSLNTAVKLAGTWTTGGYAVKVNGTVAYTEANAPKIDIVGGDFTSRKSVALYAAGYAIWNVNAKSVKGIQAMQVKSGDVTIAGGSYENTKGTIAVGNGAKSDANGVISVVGEAAGYPKAEYIDLKVNGGTFTAKEEGTYAVYITEATESKLAINGGSFASAKDKKGNQLPVINLDYEDEAVEFINKHEGMITAGEFTGSIIGEVSDTEHTVSAENATTALAPNAKTENGKVTVGDSSQQTPGTTDPSKPGEEQKPGDNEPEENPKTFDAIGSLVTMAVSSLGVIGTATKKVLR